MTLNSMRTILMLNSSQLQLAGMFPNKTNRSWSELLKTSSGWNLLCVFCSATVKDFGEEINELKQLKGGLLPAEPPKAQRLNWTNTHEICIHAPQPEGFPSPGCFSSALGWWRSPSRAPKDQTLEVALHASEEKEVWFQPQSLKWDETGAGQETTKSCAVYKQSLSGPHFLQHWRPINCF